ncbi:MAG: hypothetical protein ACTHJN_14270 [Ginsengibacter sp.]|jgi:hypothetical protein
MKARYFKLILISVFFLCCRKENTTASQSIVGTWELQTEYNGQGGSVNYPRGNGHVLIFTNTTYEVYSDGQLQNSGTYELTIDSSYMMGKLANRIIYDNQQNTIRNFVEVSSNTLFMRIDAYDAPSVKYMRLK